MNLVIILVLQIATTIRAAENIDYAMLSSYIYYANIYFLDCYEPIFIIWKSCGDEVYDIEQTILVKNK